MYHVFDRHHPHINYSRFVNLSWMCIIFDRFLIKRINIGFSTKSDRQYICETVMTWEWIIVTWSAELGIGNQGLGAGATGLWRHLGLNVMCATLPLLHTAQLAVAGIAFNKFLLEAISSNTGPDTLLASYLHTPRQEWTWLISQGFSHLWFWSDPSHKWMTAIRNLKVTVHMCNIYSLHLHCTAFLVNYF